MSGDVQPRKRKDKRKKKDDLGVEEPRGTAAVFGEGDVFMHSQHEHGTGGHWCAKIIFFSLLAVLVGLIGLIILENRGLSDLEANAVQSQYSGVLEGWLEDIPDDDHHDEHTLDLNHHDDDDDEELHGSVIGHDEHDEDDHEHSLEENEHDDELEDSQEPEHVDDDENESQQDDDQLDDEDDDQQDDEDDEQQDDDDDQQQDDDDDDQQDVDESNQDDEDESRQVDEDESNQVVEQDVDDVGNQDEDDDDEHSVEATKDEDNDEEEYKNTDTAEYEEDHDEQSDEEQGDDDLHDVDDNDNLDDDDDENDSNNNDDENQNDDENSHEDNDEDDEEHEEPEQDSDVEVEHIEKEVTDDVVLSEEKTAKDDEDSQEISREADPVDDPADEDDDVEFLESDELDELPEVLPIPVPSGKPLAEFEETSSTERPHDTLADEEEYERQQEELRKEKEQASHGQDGGNSIEADWPGEPNDPYWQDQLDQAQRELREGEWSAAEKRASHTKLAGSARARYIVARALDSAAEAKRDNALLTKAIAAYLELLKMNERLSDKKLLEVADRTLDRIKFRGNYLGAEPVYRLLIRRFPNEPQYRNNLTISFLMANRADLAENVLVETLKLWPNDKVALAHLGFVLKTNHNKLEEAVEAFTKALEGDSGPACEPRFYYHLGDALLLLGRPAAARRVHARAAARGHFLSAAQRSLYNVDRLKSRPWWKIEDTPYLKLAQDLERSWREILKEGEAAEKQYEQEKEGLKDKGEWTQWDLFVRGREVAGRCARAPVSCGVVRAHGAARSCRRGQVKFSAMRPHTHVRAHVGPTNCRLRMHLGLKNTQGTYIRVDQEIRQWEVGKVFMFDDSFEHEVWHNGTGTRLVLIVDVWHPDLTPAERAQLPAI